MVILLALGKNPCQELGSLLACVLIGETNFLHWNLGVLTCFQYIEQCIDATVFCKGSLFFLVIVEIQKCDSVFYLSGGEVIEVGKGIEADALWVLGNGCVEEKVITHDALATEVGCFLAIEGSKLLGN